MFGIKDLFTVINLMGGVVAICLCIDGRPFEAGLAVMLGYLCGDALDGLVARLLGTSNQFGAEFDTIADHTAHVIAPAAIVYTVYRDVGLVSAPWDQVLAIALAGSMVVSVSVRHARAIVQPVSYKGVWAGLPRSVLGFLAIGYCNATLAPYAPGGWWLGVFLIPLMSIATLTYLPFGNHHLRRSFFWYVRVVIVICAVITLATLVLHPAFFFDVLFFWMAGYCLSSWMALTPSERDEFRRAVGEMRGRAS